ncbi:LysR family substrate-binding domain-containing protein [Streptomyces sp. NPDC007088]|uniref:LysR family substrate-binding domain-containing protein n=1 Tax=Streptomyces sp. NPDC007088 TaxID=3364773 RepID=UPI0036C49099
MTGSDTSPSPATPSASPSFRLAFVPGVTPSKWVRVWEERSPDVPLELLPVAVADMFSVLRGGLADAGLVRLPVDGEDLSAIPLYTETTVVVVPRDHLVTAVEEVALEDLAEDLVLHPADDVLGWEALPGRPALERPATTADAVELVAAGVGVLLVPQSVARLHHRRDLTYRPVPEAPTSRVALAWPQEATTDLVEDFIGIVRGRTVNSSRGRSAAAFEARGKGAARTDKGTAKTSARRASPAKGGAGGRSGRGGAGGSGKAGGKSGQRRGKPRRRS